ncbi:MAG TPA: hypothetical protein VN785_11920 [Candidatus Angelobacter sp.]|nr:hypothetical protein [Candidatus Angelobacter sp.]
MMKRNCGVKSACVIVVAVLCGGVAAANVDLKPGKYALTITYEVQNQRQNESRSGTRCITLRDLDNPEKIFNDRVTAQPKQEESCSVKQLRNVGGKISYDAELLEPDGACRRKFERHGILSGENGEAESEPRSVSEVHGKGTTDGRLRDAGQHQRALVSNEGAKKSAE